MFDYDTNLREELPSRKNQLFPRWKEGALRKWVERRQQKVINVTRIVFVIQVPGFVEGSLSVVVY